MSWLRTAWGPPSRTRAGPSAPKALNAGTGPALMDCVCLFSAPSAGHAQGMMVQAMVE